MVGTRSSGPQAQQSEDETVNVTNAHAAMQPNVIAMHEVHINGLIEVACAEVRLSCNVSVANIASLYSCCLQTTTPGQQFNAEHFQLFTHIFLYVVHVCLHTAFSELHMTR